MTNLLLKHPNITSQIDDQTNNIIELKSFIKARSDTKLLMNEELLKIEKYVKTKQNQLGKIYKKLLILENYCQYDKNKLRYHKKNITKFQE